VVGSDIHVAKGAGSRIASVVPASTSASQYP